MIRIIFGVGAAVLAGLGIYELINEKVVTRRKDDFTEESLRNFARPDGFICLVIAAGIGLIVYVDPMHATESTLGLLGLAIMCIGMIFNTTASRWFLRKKDGTSNYRIRKKQ